MKIENKREKMKKNYNNFFREIWNIGDDIIAMCGIKIHITDIYLATITDFTRDTEEANEVIVKLAKKYKITGRWFVNTTTPIALIALSILEN